MRARGGNRIGRLQSCFVFFPRCLIACLAIGAGFLFGAESDGDISKLAAQLGASDREARREASYQLQRLGSAAKTALPELIKALDDSDKQVWANAIAAIAAIGPEAKDAVPRLIAGLDGRKSRDGRQREKSQVLLRSAFALTSIGDAARPALIEALRGDDTGLRIGAAKALGGMSARAKDAIPALIENLGHNDEELRSEVVEALGLIGADAVGPLVKSLGWPEPRLRIGSARSLAAIGASAAASSALIERLQNETEVSVRAAILTALPRVGVAQEKFVPLLIAGLRDDRDELRAAAVNALIVVRPAEKLAVPAVAALLGDAKPAIVERAVFVLGRFGAAAKSAVPALVAKAARVQPVPAVYADALTEIGGPAVAELLRQVEKAAPASLNREHWVVKLLTAIGGAGIPELTRALESPSASVRVAALGTLSGLGEQARDARAAILKLSADPEPIVRATVLSTLVAMKHDPDATLKTIEAAMRDKATVVRLAAATSAGAMGSDARALAASLAALIDDPDAAVRAAAIRAIGVTGGNDPGIAAKLSARLDDPALRSAAIEALGKLGSQSAAAAPKLIALYPKAEKTERLAILSALGATNSSESLALISGALKDTDSIFRAAALRAMAKAQPAADDLLPRLIEALRDPDVSVRRVAAEFLAAVGDKDPQKSVPALGPMIALLASTEDRTFVLDALRAMHVRDKDALTQALALPVSDARAWACERIAKLGREGQPLVEKLQPLLADKNDYVRRAARKAIDQIQGKR